MKFTQLCDTVFVSAINDYHKTDCVDATMPTPFEEGSLERLLYHKCWIDAVQWHLEDIIRDPNIDPQEALCIKRRIDASNQDRTDMVEYIDSYFLQKYEGIVAEANAKINTESPAWACDRLSILHQKLFHMKAETERSEVSETHKAACQTKLAVLQEQHKDLSTAIEELLADIASGKKYMKTYKQMKMYNDPSLNPVLYAKK